VPPAGGPTPPPQDGAVSVPHAQDPVDEGGRRGRRRRLVPVAVLDDGAQVRGLPGDVLGQDEHGRLDVGEVLVEGGRRGARLPGDVDDLHVAVGGGGQHRSGAVEEPLAGGPPASAGDPAVRGPQLVLVGRGGVGRVLGRLRLGSDSGRGDHARRLPSVLTGGQAEPAARARSSPFSTLLLALTGRASSTSTRRGALKLASRSRAQATTSSGSTAAPLRGPTKAIPTSPRRSSGTPITAAWAMSGWVSRTRSISAG